MEAGRYPAPVLFQKVAIIGVGLIGGSLGLALRRRHLAETVWGYVRRPESVKTCAEVGAVDRATTNPREAVRDADLVVMCTPVGQMRRALAEVTPDLNPGTVVTDVGSVKVKVVHELAPLCAEAGAAFVGSHPMAGAERTGVSAARADLFEGAICVVTPAPGSDPEARNRVDALWEGVGGRLLRLTPEVHDVLVSRSSHLPQLVAAGLARYVLDPSRPGPQAALCAGGFRDTTRIASGSPEMWRDIAAANRANILSALDDYLAQLTMLRDWLRLGDDAAVWGFLGEAKARRDAWVAEAAKAPGHKVPNVTA